MNRRTCFLLAGSILAAASLSCHGPEARALNPKTAAKLDSASDSRESRADRMLYEQEMITVAGLIASFL